MPDPTQKILLEKYVAAVLAAPSSFCLTATKDPVEFWERHVLDALKVLALLPQRVHDVPMKVIDIGSGNGIPGIPIAIAAPTWDVYLLDSNIKKSGFIDAFCKTHGIENVHVLSGRAEEFARQDIYRGQFDLAFARALSKLPEALELCIPFLKRHGLLLIPHGASYKTELTRSEHALKEVGAVLQESIPYQLNSDISFRALIFSKQSETPERYPRRTGIPHKRPL